MKKFLLILTNVIAVISLLIFADYYIAKTEYEYQINSHYKEMEQHPHNKIIEQNFPPFQYNVSLMHFYKYWNNATQDFETLRRKVVGNGKKKSIILFGCSFVEGSFLKDTQILSYKLSKKTGRTVYNRGFQGFGPAPMVWQVKEDKFYSFVNEDVEYVIYVYILDHLRRIYFDKYGYSNKIYIGYNIDKNGVLIENIPFGINFHRLNLISKFFKSFIFPNFDLNTKNDNKNFDLLKEHFITTRNEINKRYPNAKLIIIKHPNGLKGSNPKDRYSLGSSYTTDRWKELEKENIIVYDLLEKLDIDITNNEYTLPDSHPNEKTWDIVSEKLIKDLNL